MFGLSCTSAAQVVFTVEPQDYDVAGQGAIP